MDNEDFKAKVNLTIFVLIIIASFLLTIFCPQEEKPVTKNI